MVTREYATHLTFTVAVVLSELKPSLTGASERADRVCTEVIAAAIVCITLVGIYQYTCTIKL